MESLAATLRNAFKPRCTEEALQLAISQHAPEIDFDGRPAKDIFLQLHKDRPEIAAQIAMSLSAQIPEGREDRLRRERQAEVRTKDRLDFLIDVDPGIPETGETFDNFQPRPMYPDVQEAHNFVREWVAGFGPGILVLAGPPGVGKSHLVVAAATALSGLGTDVAYRRESDLLAELQRNFRGGESDRIITELYACPWLILDELGAAHTRDWGLQKMDDLINSRWEGAKGAQRTLIATNLTGSELPARMASRLRDQMYARSVVIHASDWRAHRGKEA